MPKTDNIPPAWQATVLSAIADSIESRTGKPPDAILKELYTKLVEEMKAAGVDQEKFIPAHIAYVAMGLRRVVRYAMRYADKNPPTHRKGYGDSFQTIIENPPPIIFYNDGTGKGSWPDGDGDGFPDPEDPGDDYGDEEDYFEWVPQEELDRANGMLHSVADEIGFGAGDEPLPFVREVAKRLGGRWGLNGKRGNPNDPSGDILAWKIPEYAPQLFDVLGDSGGQNKIKLDPLPYDPFGQAVWIEP